MGLANVLCNYQERGYGCDALEGLFNYRELGECGQVDGEICVDGNDFVSGTEEGEIYYGFCAKEMGVL